jgi:hypothetical protein
MSGMEEKNHIVFMNNYLSSHELFKKLKERNIFACGTVNPTRKGLPKLKEEKNMNRGDSDFSVSNDGMCVYRWKDKKGVNLISSVHKPSDISSVDRMEKDGN